jgi:hypothetical protein
MQSFLQPIFQPVTDVTPAVLAYFSACEIVIGIKGLKQRCGLIRC